jgi:putative flavoprotein involved in K+ transport
MQYTDTLIIGAGQAGLAASRLLTEARHDHVVIERGRVGERWLASSWDSLRLLTPNWMSRLPYWEYAGEQPDGFMSAAEVADFLAAYSYSFDAPVQAQTRVEHVRRRAGGFDVVTDRGAWRAANVVVATGWCDYPWVPSSAARLSPEIEQVAPSNYKRPEQLAPGGVLIVGASATGVQLADELRSAGRDVYLAVGAHSRMPRRYRGKDIFFWLERSGTLDRGVDDVRSVAQARREPSLQLVGRDNGASLDLAALAAGGVTLTGRLTAIDGDVVHFADDLQATVSHADVRLLRVLNRIDAFIAAQGFRAELQSHTDVLTVPTTASPRCLHLGRAGVATIMWATGFRRAYPWLHVPALDLDGELDQRYGITRVPGLYVLGQRFQRTRRSNFLDGVGADAVTVTRHLLARASISPWSYLARLTVGA